MSETASSGQIAILLPDLRGGGDERVCLNLANEFAARGIEVDLVLMQATGDFLALVDPRVRVIDLGSPRVRNLLAPLSRYLRRERPAAVLANMWPLPVVAFVARLIARVDSRLVAAEHTTWSGSPIYAKRFSRAQIRFSMRLLYPLLDGVIAVSGGVARDLCRIAGLAADRITTIYNPIVGGGRAARAPSALPAAWERGDHPKILAVGSLTPVKGFANLISALAEVRKRLDAHLLILGEGAERANLEQQIATLGLGDVANLPGYSTDPTGAYQMADLFVLSSSCEGFGNVIVEAMEHGTPVVSTDCESGPREILRDGQLGTLVPVGDVLSLADAIHAALTRSHDDDALRQRALDFTVGKAADAYLEVLLPRAPQGERPGHLHNGALS